MQQAPAQERVYTLISLQKFERGLSAPKALEQTTLNLPVSYAELSTDPGHSPNKATLKSPGWVQTPQPAPPGHTEHFPNASLKTPLASMPWRCPAGGRGCPGWGDTGRAGTRTVPPHPPCPTAAPAARAELGGTRCPHCRTSPCCFGASPCHPQAPRPSPLSFLLTRYRRPSPLSVTPPAELTPR